EKQAQELLDKIDELGGAVRAIETGFLQREILEAAYRWQRDVDRGERVVVGVNKYEMEESAPEGILRVGAELERDQVERLRALRARRDARAVAAALDAVTAAARGSENVVVRILAAVRAYATVGEISDALRKVFGVHREIVVV